MSGKFRGRKDWDPVLIVLQIFTVQLLCYATQALLILFASLISGLAPSVILMFDYKMIRLGSTKMIVVAHMINAIVGAFTLKVFVERSKSCLDFSLTFYTLHLIFTWYFSRSLPDTFIWWFVNVTCVCVMCVIGEYLCRREEMKSIQLSSI